MTRTFRSSVAALAFGSVLGVLLGACAPHSGEGGETLAVFAAASTRVLNDDFRALQPSELTFVNAGSSDLVQQLIDGAPADVLITADAQTMQRARDAGVVEQPRVVAQNTLVMVTPADNPSGLRSLADVAAPGVVVVACDPQVPCGAAAEALLATNDVALTPASLEHSVTDVLGKVVAGEADAGFVYATDAASARDAVQVIDIPGAAEHPNQILAAVAAAAPHRAAAARFVALLETDEAAAVWRRHGFHPVQ